MADATEKFFEELGRRGHEPLLSKANGSLRFDLKDGKRATHWLVDMRKGDVKVSHDNRDADGVLRTEHAVFDEIVSGNTNATASLLRGIIAFEGNPQLMVLFQRLFPGPPNARKRGRAAGHARRKS